MTTTQPLSTFRLSVLRDCLGRFHVVTETGERRPTQPPSPRELHEARARQMQRDAMYEAAHGLSRWVGRMIHRWLHRQESRLGTDRHTSEAVS